MTESADQELAHELAQEAAERGPDGQAASGVPAVDDALARLTALDELPVDEHPAVFESVHGSLRGVLGSDGV